MSLVLLPGLLSNFVYPLVLHGLSLCPALAIDYYRKGLRTGSLPPSPHLTHSQSLLKGPYSSLLLSAALTAPSHYFLTLLEKVVPSSLLQEKFVQTSHFIRVR